MKISIVSIGKTKEKFFIEAEKEYLKRLSGFNNIKIENKILDAEKPGKTITDEHIKEKEGERILKSLPKNSTIIALDEKGKQYSSEGLSSFIFKEVNQDITFIIGGHVGLSKEIRERADQVISFSKLTFTHQMIRTILLEQVYRSVCIETGKKYHR